MELRYNSNISDLVYVCSILIAVINSLIFLVIVFLKPIELYIFRASCWVIVLAPCFVLNVNKSTTTALIVPLILIPECS